MIIRVHMSSPVRTVKPLDSVSHARAVMAEARINQLPVTIDGTLVGIVTDRDLRDAFPSVFDEASKRRQAASSPDRVTVESVMSSEPLVLGPDEPLARAVALMRRERVGAVPIVEDGRLVGILTRSDVLDAYLELVGARPAGASAGVPAGASEEIRKNW